jgi:CRISPR/Cas system CSM-associated protein Csm3 (group 7 of RAMP superfamily)
MTTKLYKTLIKGTLVQKTAFTIGGNSPHSRVDTPVARDGSNQLTIPGKGLAGALIAVARRLCSDKDILSLISEGSPTEQQKTDQSKRLNESVWHFYNAHPEQGQDLKLEVRTGVGIRQDTGAAAETVKFDTEVVPIGTKWSFCLEIDDYRDKTDKTKGKALELAKLSLRQWQDGFCFLGGDVARGLGWMLLDKIQVYSLTSEHCRDWPNSNKTPKKALNQITEKYKLPVNGLEISNSVQVKDIYRNILKGSCIIKVGLKDGYKNNKENWGLDTLSIGASEAGYYLQDDILEEKLEDPVRKIENRRADMVLAWTQATNSTHPLPFIPGSSIRGPLRHSLSWWLRGKGEDIADPNATQGAPGAKDTLSRIFGNVENSAQLLISDASLVNNDYKVWFMEHHAEDEFTAGVFGNSKFNHLCLYSGEFKFEFWSEAKDQAALDLMTNHLKTLQRLGKQNQLPLGGRKWRGHGWIKWDWQLDSSSGENDE